MNETETQEKVFDFAAGELLLVKVWPELRVIFEESPDASSAAPTAMIILGLEIDPVPSKAKVPWLTVVFPV